jgi:hypothetical protein
MLRPEAIVVYRDCGHPRYDVRSLVDGMNTLQAASSSEATEAIYHTPTRHIRVDRNIWQNQRRNWGEWGLGCGRFDFLRSTHFKLLNQIKATSTNKYSFSS